MRRNYKSELFQFEVLLPQKINVIDKYAYGKTETIFGNTK
jgi:hypothetical protein